MADDTSGDSDALDSHDDEEWYDLLWDAERDGLVEIGIDLKRLNRPTSPVFSMWDNAVPGIVYVTAILATLIFTDWIWALATAASGLILILTTINFLVMMRLRRRAWAMARSELRGWRVLWHQGGLSLRLPGRPGIEARSPDDDWRDFARDHLPGDRA